MPITEWGFMSGAGLKESWDRPWKTSDLLGCVTGEREREL